MGDTINGETTETPTILVERRSGSTQVGMRTILAEGYDEKQFYGAFKTVRHERHEKISSIFEASEAEIDDDETGPFTREQRDAYYWVKKNLEPNESLVAGYVRLYQRASDAYLERITSSRIVVPANNRFQPDFEREMYMVTQTCKDWPVVLKIPLEKVQLLTSPDEWDMRVGLADFYTRCVKHRRARIPKHSAFPDDLIAVNTKVVNDAYNKIRTSYTASFLNTGTASIRGDPTSFRKYAEAVATFWNNRRELNLDNPADVKDLMVVMRSVQALGSRPEYDGVKGIRTFNEFITLFFDAMKTYDENVEENAVKMKLHNARVANDEKAADDDVAMLYWLCVEYLRTEHGKVVCDDKKRKDPTGGLPDDTTKRTRTSFFAIYADFSAQKHATAPILDPQVNYGVVFAPEGTAGASVMGDLKNDAYTVPHNRANSHGEDVKVWVLLKDRTIGGSGPDSKEFLLQKHPVVTQYMCEMLSGYYMEPLLESLVYYQDDPNRIKDDTTISSARKEKPGYLKILSSTFEDGTLLVDKPIMTWLDDGRVWAPVQLPSGLSREHATVANGTAWRTTAIAHMDAINRRRAAFGLATNFMLKFANSEDGQNPFAMPGASSSSSSSSSSGATGGTNADEVRPDVTEEEEEAIVNEKKKKKKKKARMEPSPETSAPPRKLVVMKERAE